MNKKVKFIIGGMIFVALTKINNLKEQTFGLSALVGFVTAGVLLKKQMSKKLRCVVFSSGGQ